MKQNYLMTVRVLLVFITTLALAACTVGPNYKKPVVPVPDRFYGAAGAATEASLADAKWFEVFGDPVLKSLIEEALRNGYDARIAVTRVEEARARYGIAGAARFPDVDYQVRAGYGRANGDTGGAITANVAAGWEIDLWGRIRRLNEAARAEYLASEEGERAVRLALVSEVAAAYFDLRELDEELRIARHTTETFQGTFDLFDRRLKGGTASAVETSRAGALLANARAQIPVIESDIIATENDLNVLLGRVPGPIERGAALAEQPIPPAVPAGLPAALLLRRPDVRAAEQDLIAANATWPRPRSIRPYRSRRSSPTARRGESKPDSSDRSSTPDACAIRGASPSRSSSARSCSTSNPSTARLPTSRRRSLRSTSSAPPKPSAPTPFAPTKKPYASCT
jgi:multidrug efflux system outer membrane protein